MPTYITLMKFTEHGSKDLKNAPWRFQSAMKAWELMGGTILGAYFVMGEYDYVAITQISTDEDAVSASMAVCGREHVKTTTLRAFPIEEFARLVDRLP
jgi:uncharacterized protein with GYD domain